MGSKTTKTSQTQDTNNTITPSNPAWVDNGLQGIAGNISNLSNLDPYSLIAGPDPLQTQAGQGAANLTSSPGFGQAADIANSVAGSATPSIAGHLAEFQDPWLNDVVKNSLAGFDQNAGYSRAQDTLARGGDTTFGGSGGAIQTALNEQNIAQGRATLDSGLRSQGFQTALGGATAQAGLDSQSMAQRLQAAGLLSSNAAAQGQDTRSNLGTQMSMGQILQQLAQQRAGAPVSLLGTQASLFSGLPLGLEHGQTDVGHSTSSGTQTVSDPMGSIGTGLMGAAALFGAPFTGGASLGLLGSLGGAAGLGSAAAGAGSAMAAFSDRRLKWDIQKIGEMTNGLGLYFFRYLWSPRQHVGVMAQEVQKVKPEAVITTPSGYLAVNYGML